MTADDFAKLFDEQLSHPLMETGFKQHGRSLYLHEGHTQIALIRAAGKFVIPGRIAHIVAFRHDFLRETKELVVPHQQPRYPEQYPWIIDAEQLPGSSKSAWNFAPQRHMNLPYGRYVYEGRSIASIVNHLKALRDALLARYVPWARSVTPEDGLRAMTAHTRDWWIARIWAEDYQRFLANAV